MAKGMTEVALLLHTSGSTSQPKIVPLTHTNLCSSALSIRTALGLTPSDCCLTIMPWFHINALVTSGLSTLAAGASLACPPAFHAPGFFEWLEEFRPAWYSAVPTMQQAIVDRARQSRPDLSESRLRFVRSSASALSPQLREQIETLLRVPVIDGYGLTEANCSVLNPLPPGIRKPGSVGRIVCGETAIMGEGGILLPPGETGEIVIRGPHVIRGYKDDPEANRASFSGDWFHTGDQGRFDHDGYLFLTGRIKEIINRGGEKIAPREVDEALLAHPSVAEAVAFAIPDPNLGEDVAAAVVPRRGAQITPAEMRDFAGLRLAPFKVPRRIIVLAELPKGPTGKVNRIGLAPKLGLTTPDLGDEPRFRVVATQEDLRQAAGGWTERILTRIWEEVLQCRPIGRHQDFVSLGGHSLLAAKIVARVEMCLGKRLSLSSLLEAPTVARMTALIGEESRPEASCAITLQTGASGVPIYLLHGSPIFTPLVRALPADQPLWSVSHVDANTLPAGFTLEDIAERQIRAIREVQPGEPYILAGWCAGGVLAYEMAQQLSKQGRQVPLLVLFEAFNPARLRDLDRWASLRYRVLDRLNRERFQWRNLASQSAGDAYRQLRERFRNALSEAQLKAWGLQRGAGFQPGRIDSSQCLVHAIRRYTPLPYQGPVLYFIAEHRPPGRMGDASEGWRELVKDLEVCEVPGDHAKMFSELNVQVIAQTLAERSKAVSSNRQEFYAASGRR